MFSVDEILPSSSGELSVNIPDSGNVALSSGFSAGTSSLCTTNQVPSECWLITGRGGTLRPDAPRPSGRYGRSRRAAPDLQDQQDGAGVDDKRDGWGARDS